MNVSMVNLAKLATLTVRIPEGGVPPAIFNALGVGSDERFLVDETP